MSKIILIIIISIVSALFLFAGLLYYTLRTKVRDVSDKKPYSDFVNKKLSLKRSAVIAKNREAEVYSNPYLLTEKEGFLSAEAQPRYTLPAGTTIFIKVAKIYKNGTSGFEHAYILGSVYVKELKTEVPFEYNWGVGHISIYGDYEDYWTYPTALWQETAIEGKFYFK